MPRFREDDAQWAGATLVAFVISTLLACAWLAIDRAPLVADQVAHVTSAIEFNASPGSVLGSERPFYPPAVYAAMGTALGLTDFRLDTSILLVNAVYLAILLTSTFLLGRELWSPRAGGIAAVVVCFFPAIIVHLRAPMLDLPLTALVSASIFALVRSRGFDDRWWAVAFGVLFGIGWLTKQAYIIAVAGPILWVAVTRVRSRLAILNGGIALVLAAVISLPWYVPRAAWFLGDYARIQSDYAASRGDPETLTAFGLAYHFIGTWHQASLIFVIAWLATLPWFLRSDRRAIPLVWWAGTVVLSTALDLKDSRFLMPALPAIALMIGRALDVMWEEPKTRIIAPSVLAILAIVGVAQAWALSFNSALPWGNATVFNRVERDERPTLLAANYRLALNNSSRADRDGWGIADAIEPLSGRVGVAGNYFLRDAIRLPALIEAGRTSTGQRLVLETTCPPPPDSNFDVIVVQVGGPDAPPNPDACAPGMRESYRGPLAIPHLLLGAHSIVIYQREPSAP